MDKHRAEQLLDKYIQGEATEREKALVEYWLVKEAGKSQSELEVLPYEQRHAAMWAIVSKSIDKREIKLWSQPAPNWVRRLAAISTAWKVAAAVAAITLGIWLYNISSHSAVNPDHEVVAKQILSGSDIGPGKNTATLTLANGKTIALSDQKTGVVIGDNNIKYNDGSFLSPSGRDGVAREGSSNSKVQTLTASTPRGGTYQVTLPDGTHVWLNADSKISFPSQFSSKQRKILLSGEAYFEVAKVIRLSPSGRDGRRPERVPFIVESDGQQVEVLGTHFNINAYNDEGSTKTTLLEGSVRVAFGSPSASHSSLPRGEMASAREGNTREGNKNNSNPLSPQGGSLPGGERGIVLKPNEQSTLAKAGKITVKQVDPNTAIAWKNGNFIFNGEDIESIMRKLARWYNIDVVYEGAVTSELYYGNISRFKNISDVLRMLEKAQGVHFRVEEHKVIVMK